MNLGAELQRVIADPAIAASVAQLVEKLLTETRAEIEGKANVREHQIAEQMARRDAELFAAKTKIDALVLELAHLKRMRFGTKSEALGADTKDLFQETLEADIAAAKLELERRQAEAGEQAKPPRSPRERAGRQPLPDHLPRIEHRHEPETQYRRSRAQRDPSPSRRRCKIQRLLRRLTKRKLNRFYRATFFQRLPLNFEI